MPLQVLRAASAFATAPCGSSLSASAMSAQGRPSMAAVFGPSTLMNSSVPRVKRLSASVCQTKRNGKRRGSASATAGLGTVGAVCAVARAAVSDAVNATSSVIVAPAPRRRMVAGQAAMSPSARPLSDASRASCSAPSATRSRLSPKRSRAAGMASISSPSAVNTAAGRSRSASSRCARSGKARSWPARSVATTSTAELSSASAMREQRQTSLVP